MLQHSGFEDDEPAIALVPLGRPHERQDVDVLAKPQALAAVRACEAAHRRSLSLLAAARRTRTEEAGFDGETKEYRMSAARLFFSPVGDASERS